MLPHQLPDITKVGNGARLRAELAALVRYMNAHCKDPAQFITLQACLTAASNALLPPTPAPEPEPTPEPDPEP